MAICRSAVKDLGRWRCCIILRATKCLTCRPKEHCGALAVLWEPLSVDRFAETRWWLEAEECCIVLAVAAR